MDNVTQNAVIPVSRDIGIITSEIRTICRQSQVILLTYAVEIGRRLKEAKNALPYGEWGKWLKNEVDFSQSSANKFMKLFEEYGDFRFSFSLSGEDSESITNLPYSKALQLLAIPREEREDFVSKNDVDGMSVKELKNAIEERDKAKAREAELEGKITDLEKLVDLAKDKYSDYASTKKALEELREEHKKSKENEKTLSEKLAAARKDPKIPAATLKKIKEDAKNAAEKASEESFNKKLSELQKRLDQALSEKESAIRTAESADKKLAEAENKLKVSLPEVSAFKALFSSVQRTVDEMYGLILKVDEKDSETAKRLHTALKTFVSDVVDKQFSEIGGTECGSE